MESQDLENYYHICTSGLSRNLLFRNNADYIVGMNDIPLCSIPNNVKIYCFCLMSNHVHFVVRGKYDDCVKFIRQYKRSRSTKLNIPLYDAEICVKLLDDYEYLLTAIGYVLRNPLAANLGIMPGEYLWSSANLYFASRSHKQRCLRPLSEINLRERWKLLKSRQPLPEDYLISDEGLISPACYVQYNAVEKLYSSPRKLLYYLSRNQDVNIELETGVVAKAKYNDEELLASLNVLSMEKFHQREFGKLKIEDKIIIAKELRVRYGANSKQIARLTRLSPEILSAILD